MCKACKMDPKDMQRFYTRQGAVEVDDFYKEVNYRPKKKVKSKAARRGCPGNDNKAHVYIWTSELEPTGTYRFSWDSKPRPTFHLVNGFHRYEAKVCVGCKKVLKRRYTEEFQKLLDNQGWWVSHYGYWSD